MWTALHHENIKQVSTKQKNDFEIQNKILKNSSKWFIRMECLEVVFVLQFLFGI